MTKNYLNLATDPRQYDSGRIDWSHNGDVDSASRKYLRYYLLPKLDVKGKSVLDIGCGFGQLFPSLEDGGAKEIVGIDSSKTCVKYTKNKYPKHNVIETSLDEYKSNRLFDVAIVIMVFEHIKDIDSAFAKIRSFINHGGALYVITGDRDYVLRTQTRDKMETEIVSHGVIAVKLKKSWGTVYDIFRPYELYMDTAKKAGFSVLEHIPLIPNDDVVEFMPKYKTIIGTTTNHLFIFRNP